MTKAMEEPTEPTERVTINEAPVKVSISLWQFLLGCFFVVVAVVLGAVLLVTVYLVPIFDELRDNGRTTACNAKANGQVWRALATNLGVPPAPSQQREDAIKEIQSSAEGFEKCP